MGPASKGVLVSRPASTAASLEPLPSLLPASVLLASRRVVEGGTL